MTWSCCSKRVNDVPEFLQICNLQGGSTVEGDISGHTSVLLFFPRVCDRGHTVPGQLTKYDNMPVHINASGL